MRIFYGYKLTFSGLEKFLDNDWDHQKSESHRQYIPLNICPIIEINIMKEV